MMLSGMEPTPRISPTKARPTNTTQHERKKQAALARFIKTVKSKVKGR